ncbi:MAG: MerR family transcriptional regulator [Leptolyngbya sp. SIO1D8]|nr:MerR family transcriptional regulator [Leptolyngbya sp. SIO1D8]
MFRIGEFSKIAQVPASQLRYYDDIGLFTPIHSDRETGYRYYSVQQLAQLNRILALKNLGLSLDQIKRLVGEDVSADEIRGMLALRKAQIEQTIQAEAVRLRAVESRLQQLERKGQIQDDDVVLKSLPAQPFLALRHQCHSVSEAFAIVNDIGQIVPNQVKTKALGHFAAVIHGEQYEPDDLDLELGFLLNQDLDIKVPLSSGLEMTVRELPSIPTALTAMRFGGPEKGIPCYSAIGTWAETHQYQLIGPGREVFLVPPKPGHESEMVVEIQYPIAATAA